VLQLKVRAFGVQLVRLWATIGDVARETWNYYAYHHPETDGMGVGKRLSGLNWYVRCNSRLMLEGLPPVTTAPEVDPPIPVAELLATGGSGQYALTWTAPDDAQIDVIIYHDGPHSAGRLGSIHKAKYKYTARSTVKAATISGLSAGTYTVYVRSQGRVTGLVSAWVSAIVTVT
jgi:hypothetical protein